MWQPLAAKEGEAMEMGDQQDTWLETAVKLSKSILQVQPEMDFKTSL
jgi:hypothetical protein